MRHWITREEAMAAVNDAGEPIRPCDVLPPEGRYREQIKPLYAAWLICYLDEIREHGWPDMPHDDNDGERDKSRYSDPQIAALAFTAEISTRLDKCGRDGRLCLAYYKAGWMPRDIKANWHLFGNDRQDRKASEQYICQRIWNALLYCSGKRKGPYRKWLEKRRNRQDTKRICQNNEREE